MLATDRNHYFNNKITVDIRGLVIGLIQERSPSY
jgi:hypothetical protein